MDIRSPQCEFSARSYLSAVLTDVQLDFTADPRLLTPARMATAIMDATTAYSIEVTADRSAKKAVSVRMSYTLRR